MHIKNKHSLYNKWLPLWTKTKDAICGQDQVKSKNTDYLKMLNGQDERSYLSYLDRAQYANFSGRTVDVALGQLFRKTPVTQGLDEGFIANVDLSGTTFYYFSKELAREVLATNRQGVWIDYSKEFQRGYLLQYKAEDIINWKTKIVDGVEKTILVVLEGGVDYSDDIFCPEERTVWRVLILEEGIYKVRDYEETVNNLGTVEYSVKNEYIPLMDGSPLDFIPFYPVTSDGITYNIYRSAMLDFANVNLGHYKNSADYENMLHWTGAKTFVTSGWDESKIFPVGGCANLPTDGKAEILEASSDSGLKDEMRHKEEQMSIMGSNLISGRGKYVQSAETARIGSQGEYATLGDISNALSDSMTHIIKIMLMWENGQDEDVRIEYNKDFELATLEPDVLTAYMSAVQSGFMSWETYYYNMKNKELYPEDWSIEDERKAIEKGQEDLVVEDDEEIEPEEDIIEDEE